MNTKNLPIIILFLVLIFGGISAFSNQSAIPKLDQKELEQSFANTEGMPSYPTTAVDKCNGEVVPQLAEGPYYKKNSPNKTNFQGENAIGTKIIISGYVFDIKCQPIPNAWLDFWQADGNGDYDTDGYRFRGHQYTDEQGRYRLHTIIPGEYPGRTPHIHVKVRGTEESETITTQLFMPDEEQNATDAIFDERLVITATNGVTGKMGIYNFVVPR